MTGIILGAVIGVILVVGLIFYFSSPQFGASPSAQEKKRYQASGNFQEGKFINQVPTSMDMSAGEMFSTIKEYIKGGSNRRPDYTIPVNTLDSARLAANDSTPQLIWFGHSAVLLQLEGKNILLDPMLGEVPAPHPALGQKRYNTNLPIEIEKLPAIDVVLISHDHYDHLDYGSIQELKSKTKHFLVPLGVGPHLKAWGVAEAKIQEFNWWEQSDVAGLQLVFAPSRHFSGRGLTDRNKTLWGSWIIQSQSQKVYFSGDSGYGPHFKEIGQKYGPFDFAMIECGQYNEKWAQIHMMPEESVQAALDVNARVMMPIHWGAFTLAMHSWTDPVERASQKAQQKALPLITPKIGEPVKLSDKAYAYGRWWENKTELVKN